MNRIESIKTLRIFCEKTFGATCGLLEAKYAIDSVLDNLKVVKTDELRRAALEALKNGASSEDLHDAVKAVFAQFKATTERSF